MTGTRTSILFACVRNGGKSQMAALKRLLKLEWICRRGIPRSIDGQLLAGIDQPIILGAAAQVELPDGVQPTIERWSTDEPSARGIKGIGQMRLICDDTDDRVRDLLSQLIAQ